MKYKTVYADPPWEFEDLLDDTRKKPYRTLGVDELCNLPVHQVVEDKSHLYLWVPTTMIEDGLRVMRAWGFDYKTIIVWVKRTANWKIWFGLGHYFRNSVELCLFGVRGKLKTLSNNTRNIFDARKPGRHHSAKPDMMYDIIENNSPPPYLEMFATIEMPGWKAWGNEMNGLDIRSKFKYFSENDIL
jgi:N6-adenosine-specific RNA methylase IME4